MAYLNDHGPFGDATTPAAGGNTLTNVIGGIVQGVATAFGKGQPPPVVVPQDTGPDLTTILLVGGIGLGAILILRKRK